MNVIKWGLYECGLANAHWHIDAGYEDSIIGTETKTGKIHEQQFIIYFYIFLLKLIPRKWHH